MSIRTEEAYCQWIERFLRFHKEQSGQWRHPAEMGSDEINAFLTHLAVDSKVAASTQNQALSALLFLYTKVLKRIADWDPLHSGSASLHKTIPCG
jgi:hypothetical protein